MGDEGGWGFRSKILGCRDSMFQEVEGWRDLRNFGFLGFSLRGFELRVKEGRG